MVSFESGPKKSISVGVIDLVGQVLIEILFESWETDYILFFRGFQVGIGKSF